MKFVLLAIFVLFAAQPMQASSCDMPDGQDTPNSQHGNMHDGPMVDNEPDMDCCDHDTDDPDDGCNPMSHCGACPAGLAAIYSSAPNADFSSHPQQFSPVLAGPLSRCGPPPFRPPIA